MNKIRMLITVVLVCCIVFGWVSAFLGNIKDADITNKNIETARQYVEKGLYQKAIQNYQQALENKENVSVRNELLNAYKLGLDDGVVSSNSYTAAYLEACELYPNNISYWETIFSYYVSAKSFSKAYDVYKMIQKNEISSEEIIRLTNELLYSFLLKPTNYSEFYRSPTGYYTVYKNEKWGMLTPTAEKYGSLAYDYVVPMSSSGYSVFISSKDTRVYDINAVVQNVLTESFSKARAYGNGYVPVFDEKENWRYFNVETGEYSTSFADASSFVNGVAAVKNIDKWQLIDTNFNSVTDQTFDDVKLYGNGEYIYGNIMVASRNGSYGLFDATGKVLSDFAAIDMDNYFGEYIAYKDKDGLWGYINNKGEVVIPAQFKSAKSFSKGLAAVSDGQNWGFIKTDGTLVIEYQYAFADYFTSSGVCLVGEEVGAYYFIELRYA